MNARNGSIRPSHIIKQKILDSIWIITIDLYCKLYLLLPKTLAQQILEPIGSLVLRVFLDLFG